MATALWAGGTAEPSASGVSKFEGVLIDKESSSIAETRVVAGGRLEGGMMQAYMHTRKDLLEPQNRKSGYGVFDGDQQKFFAFDAAGNQKALAVIQTAKKDYDFRVEVTGKLEGGVLKVATIKLAP
jgi:hypothetical protein